MKTYLISTNDKNKLSLALKMPYTIEEDSYQDIMAKNRS